jgi:ATP-binding cassette subfamily B protein
MPACLASTLPKTLSAFLWHAVQPQLKWFLCIAILPVAWGLQATIFPYCTKLLIDTISTFTGNKNDIYTYLATPLWIWGITWAFLIFNWRFLDIADLKFIPTFQATIRFRIFEYLEKHSHQYFSNELAGGLANKISDIANGGWDVLTFLFRELVPTSFAVFISIVVLATVNPTFSIIFTLFFIAHMSICYKLSNRIEKLSDIHSQTKSTLQGNIVDSLSNIVNVRLFSRNIYELSYLNQFQQTEIAAQKRLLWSLFTVRSWLEWPSLLMIIGTLYFLIRGWQHDQIGAGDFAFVITVAFNVIMSVWQLGWRLPDFFKQVGTCQQALSLIRQPHQIRDLPDAPDLMIKQGKIVFDNVHFHYNPNIDLFKNKNITIQPGEKIGLVGFSGSGKSTFVNLILRYYDIESGAILIDDQNIAKVTQDSLRNNIAMIPQDVTLFHRSLKENIKYGSLTANEDDIILASQKAHCHEFIQQLELGYETLVGERGIKLSGGQRQRIAIARAILKNAPILILDEATSALDSMTEQHIQESLNELMKNRTTLVIAHRLSTLLGMNKILVFHQGQIIEQGTHQSLLAQNGHYATLWKMQIGGFLPDHPV